VIKDIAGIRFVHDNITPNGIKALESQINKGKAYIAALKKYEKDLADWKAGKKKKAAAKPVDVPKDKAKEDPVTGTWECEMEPFREGMPPFGLVLVLELEDTNVTGTAQMSMRGRPMGQPSKVSDGKFEDGTLTRGHHRQHLLQLQDQGRQAQEAQGQRGAGAHAGPAGEAYSRRGDLAARAGHRAGGGVVREEQVALHPVGHPGCGGDPGDPGRPQARGAVATQRRPT
jgi:hypothetical protein